MRFKVFLAHHLQRALRYLEGRPMRENSVFDDLSPIDNVQNMDNYNQALSWAIGNDRIKNIAVTGPYGSGKSSLLKTFEKNNPDHHYFNVSLASFQDESKSLE